MDKPLISFRSIGLTIGFALVVLFFSRLGDFFYQKTKVVFCDVGQGDAAYIRTREKYDILVDAGPDRKILSCLGKYLPFYDRKIELAFLSHPQKDHLGGYLQIIDRYQIDNFVVTSFEGNSQSLNLLKRKLKEKKIKVRKIFAGEKIVLKSKGKKASEIVFLWPSRQLLKHLLKSSPQPDLNDLSAIFVFSEGDFQILFTGDASPRVLNILTNAIDSVAGFPVHYRLSEAMAGGPAVGARRPVGGLRLVGSPATGATYRDNQRVTLPIKLEILKVPHHGSKNGLTYQFLKLADPTLSVISVGKNNSYGHPSKEVLNMFKALKKKYLRTDEEGDIVIEVDERGWRLR